MEPEQLQLIEKYLNGIISRCERLTRSITHGLMFIVFVVLVCFAIYIYVVGMQTSMSLVTTGTVSILACCMIASLYVIFHLHACMNECDLIKLQISIRGKIDDASETIKHTKCTRNLEVERLKKLVTPV